MDKDILNRDTSYGKLFIIYDIMHFFAMETEVLYYLYWEKIVKHIISWLKCQILVIYLHSWTETLTCYVWLFSDSSKKNTEVAHIWV